MCVYSILVICKNIISSPWASCKNILYSYPKPLNFCQVCPYKWSRLDAPHLPNYTNFFVNCLFHTGECQLFTSLHTFAYLCVTIHCIRLSVPLCLWANFIHKKFKPKSKISHCRRPAIGNQQKKTFSETVLL